MTITELQKRSERAQSLRVLQTDDGQYYVDSSEGKILYRVTLTEDEESCSCGDYARGVKSDPVFKCKHILAADNCAMNSGAENAQFLERKRPRLDERFITKIENKEFVLYAGLLDLGHQKGILKIEVEPLQFPTKENGNFAICRAVVISKTGESFTDVGDANPGNCSSRVSRHLLRLASTRAIARALRSFTNIGMTCLEELADVNETSDNGPLHPRPGGAKKSPQKSKSKKTTPKEDPELEGQRPEPREDEPAQGMPAKMSEAQKRAIYNLSRRRGVSVEEVEDMVREKYDCAVEELSSKDASEFIRSLQQAA